MKRLILGFAAAALVSLVSPLFAQNKETTFRTIASGLWTTSDTWQYESGNGVWLVPIKATPGDTRNRNVDVIIDNGTSVRIAAGDVVQVNSLHVREGDLIVEGTLLVGDFSSEVAGVNNDAPTRDRITSGLVLEQNVPNPVSPMLGTETTFRFYLDKKYAGVRLALYDLLGVEIQTLYEAVAPQAGWQTVRLRVQNLPSGNYPVILQVPGMPMERRLMTVVR